MNSSPHVPNLITHFKTTAPSARTWPFAFIRWWTAASRCFLYINFICVFIETTSISSSVTVSASTAVLWPWPPIFFAFISRAVSCIRLNKMWKLTFGKSIPFYITFACPVRFSISIPRCRHPAARFTWVIIAEPTVPAFFTWMSLCFQIRTRF